MAHHAVTREQETWCGRPKMENYYRDRKDYIRTRGSIVNEDWLPEK